MLKLTLGNTYDHCKVLFIFCQLFYLAVVRSYPQLTPNRSEIEKYIKEQAEILDDLLEGYDKRFIPAIPGKPLEVKLQIVVSDVLYVDDNKMESEMMLYLRQVWFDYRFIRNCSSTRKIKVREHLLDKIWLPDIRMRNLIDIKRFDGFGGINMNIHENGRIYYSQMVLVKITCPMDLRNFPMDKQTCYLNFSSYAYSKNLLFFSLRKEKVIMFPVHLPQFEFVEAKEINQTQNTSSVPKVTIALTFRRRSGYYMIQIYLPSIFLVILSWLAFLMEASDIADRLTLEVSMILSIVFLLCGVNTSLPHVSYPKASDWFIMASFWFIFLALLQTMLVYRMTSHSGTQSGPLAGLQKCWSAIFSRLKLAKTAKNGQVAANEQSEEQNILRKSSENAPVQVEADGGKKSWSEAFWLDKMSVIAFPVFYLMFNIIYWRHYL